MPDIDIVSDLLSASLKAFPDSNFIQSLCQQYLIRGWLSKKQLQGLYDKASKVSSIPPGKLATLEAQLLKMPSRFKSPLPAPAALYKKDERTGEMINKILAKYPTHKMVVYLKTKYDRNETLSATEVADLQRFYTRLL
jgi:hypothetical protein